jgi:hypothetical protein
VGFVLNRIADGWSEAEILGSYPHVTPDDLQAVFAFARYRIRQDGFTLRMLELRLASFPRAPFGDSLAQSG